MFSWKKSVRLSWANCIYETSTNQIKGPNKGVPHLEQGSLLPKNQLLQNDFFLIPLTKIGQCGEKLCIFLENKVSWKLQVIKNVVLN